MRFGITFYPDQWPSSYWNEAFGKIKEIGFELVRFNEMTWSLLEPEEGKFNFAWLDHALELCKKYELKVVLGNGAVQAPQWLIQKYPQILPVANDGEIHPGFGPRPNFCRDNPIYRKYALRLTEKIARRYAHHPALEMWQLDNEPSYPPLDLPGNKDWCHCRHTRSAFIKWCKSKYQNILDLNQAWGTIFWSGTFTDFNQISPPKGGMWEGGNPHIYLDWCRFKSAQLSDWLIQLKKTIRKYDIVHKIGTNSFTNIPNRIPDHEILSSGLDWFGWDIYPAATQNSDQSLSQIADYWNSVCKRNSAEFIVAELQAGPTVRWGNPAEVRGSDLKNWVKVLAEHGATTILLHNFRPPLFGCETGGYGLLDSSGGETERSKAMRKIIKENSRPSRPDKQLADIAIVYLKSSEIQTFQEEGWARGCGPGWVSGRADLGLLFGLNSLAGAYKLAYPDRADFIFENQLEETVPGHKILLLPNPYLLSKKHLENLKRFVEKGGLLISDSRFGLKDQNGHLRPAPLLQDWLSSKGGSLPVPALPAGRRQAGASGGQFSYEGCEIIPAYREGIPIKLTIPKLKVEVDGFRDRLAVSDKVLAKFSDGLPALVEKKIGRGRIIYAAFSLFSNLNKGGNKKLLNYVKGKLK